MARKESLLDLWNSTKCVEPLEPLRLSFVARVRVVFEPAKGKRQLHIAEPAASYGISRKKKKLR